MEGAGKVPFWRKLLHWPVVGGREIIWTCLGANAIPGKVDDLKPKTAEIRIIRKYFTSDYSTFTMIKKCPQ